jgi:RecJ-like exonuclease
MAGTVSGWFKRLTRDDDQLHAEVLSEEVDATGSMRALVCCQGDKVKLHGRLRYVDLRPTDTQATLVAELYDGTEGVQLIWLGRRSIPGIEPGRTLNVRGRVAMRDGQKVIYNPDYDLLPVHA